MTSARIPRLAVIAWSFAVAILAGLGVAVAHYLSSSSGPGGRHPGMSMQMGTADAITRGGGGSPLHPIEARLFTAWQLDTIAVAVLVVAAACYLTGVALAPVRSGQSWPVRRTVAFLCGLVACAVATNGSIAVYDQALFTAHMAGHLALVMAAPALIMFGRPLRLALETSPPARRARLARVATGRVVSLLTAPPVVLATYAAVIVGSHLTGIMDTIMRNTWAGQVEHLVYLLAGCQFFVLIVGDEPIRWRLGAPARWLLLALAMAVDTFTGIVLMQGTHAVQLAPSGLHVDALSDTRTGGAIMWVGGDGIMALIMVILVVGWLRTVDTAAPEQGWLEQARVATFREHTAAEFDSTSDEAGIDGDDAARTAYNEYLSRLASREPQR